MPAADPSETLSDTVLDETATPPRIGRRLGEFTLSERIGAGTFGEVWRARQDRLDREVAVKVPHPTHLFRAQRAERFLHEARVAARLDHPYAAHVYGYGVEPDGTAWIAMELVRGETLAARLARLGPAPIEEAVPLIVRIAEVVQAAHARGIVHRDLKPSNVVIVEEGGRSWPKLLDFGVARLDDTPDAPPAGQGVVRAGSPLYMAPEQWSRAESVDARCDQYALALVAYEVLSGQAPFRASTLEGLAEAHAHQALPWLGPRFPRGLDAVLSRAAAKRPEDRYPDVREFAVALEAVGAAAVPAGAPMVRLPAATSPFIGRATERADVAAAVMGGRLVTVVGPGGAGKTRLALQVAADVASRFPDGVCAVELLEVHAAEEVVRAVARALGVEEGTTAGLRAWLGLRRQLLVIDNCEHVLTAVATLAHTLLRSCPRLAILATSREALGLSGETVWPLPPMEIPYAGADLDLASRSDAVQLFADRARAADPGFRLTAAVIPAVVRICRRLDGIPLAIELAASRARVLPPAALADRLQSSFSALGPGLRGAPPHHRTLRAAIDWGHALLTEPERVAFRRLAALAGPFELDVADVAIGGPDATEHLVRLVERSMVARMPDGRYRLLETLREYGLEQLGPGEGDEVRRAVLRWLAAGSAEVVWGGWGRDASALLARWAGRAELVADALARAEALDAVDDALSLFGNLWRHWEISLPEPAVRTAAAGLLATGRGDLGPRARAWEALAASCWRAGEMRASLEAHQEAERLAREAGDTATLAFALFGQAGWLILEQRADEAVPALVESLALGEALGDARILDYAHHHLGGVATAAARYGEAERHYELSRRHGDVLGDRHGDLVNRYRLAVVQRLRGDRSGARAALGRLLVEGPDAGDVEAVAECLETLAEWLLEDGAPAIALQWDAAAQAIRERCGDDLSPREAAAHAERLTRARQALGDAAFRAAWAEGAAYDLDRVLAVFARPYEG